MIKKIYFNSSSFAIYGTELNLRPTSHAYFEVLDMLVSIKLVTRIHLRLYDGNFHNFDYMKNCFIPPIHKHLIMIGHLHGSVTKNIETGRITVEGRGAALVEPALTKAMFNKNFME